MDRLLKVPSLCERIVKTKDRKKERKKEGKNDAKKK